MKYNCSSHFIALEIMKNSADAGVHIGKAEEELDDDNKMYIILQNHMNRQLLYSLCRM